MKNKLIRVPNVAPEMYHFPWLASLGFANFVTGRGGGVSAEPYATLNTDYAGDDDPANVAENMRRIYAAAGVKTVWTPRQVHGADIAVIDNADAPPMDADGVIVSGAGIMGGVRTADCLPLFLVDPKKRVGAIIHAGRRSTEMHIAAKTLSIMMSRFGCNPADVTAALGPCIRECCYEVDEGTASRFQRCCGGGDGRLLDIAGANIRQLSRAGVDEDRIIDCGICATCENGRFYSYRKDGKITGRFLSALGMLE